LDDHLTGWLDDDDKSVPPWDLEDPQNLLLEQEKSLGLWQLCQSVEWAHLPREGGWEEQDETFLHDMMVISRRLSYLRKSKRADKDAHEKAAKKMGIKR
jgi:hypothetical protein